LRCAIYARVSTFDQEPENQLAELRRYAVILERLALCSRAVSRCDCLLPPSGQPGTQTRIRPLRQSWVFRASRST